MIQSVIKYFSKYFLLTAMAMLFGLSGMTARAGGIETMQPIYSGLYFEGDVGYAGIAWYNFEPGPLNFGALGSYQTINTHGGVVFGLDLGYAINQYFAVEVGWLDLPIVRGIYNYDFAPTSVSASAVSGSAYGDGKISLPIYSDTLYLFTKVGAIFRYTRLTASAPLFVGGTLAPINGRYWTVLFAVGTQYYFTPNWSIHVQYMRIPGFYQTFPFGTTTELDVPPANVITAGIGYKILL